MKTSPMCVLCYERFGPMRAPPEPTFCYTPIYQKRSTVKGTKTLLLELGEESFIVKSLEGFETQKVIS